MSEKSIVVVSSTVRDLPEYRQYVMDACLRVNAFPNMMEQLPAMDADAIQASLKLVDEADVYIGIFAHRYGYVPKGHQISITEMEYRRAVERKIPRLIFIMDDSVPVLPVDYDHGVAYDNLLRLKERLKKERVIETFVNREDLRGKVIQSLESLRAKKKSWWHFKDKKNQKQVLADDIHPVSFRPQKPEPYIAHPYSLLKIKGLIGRKEELEMLTNWITQAEFKDIAILSVVAIGGMGKSALTWTWFNDIAPQEKEWAGRVWWSFYETNASFENFVTNTLSYVSDQSLEYCRELPLSVRMDALIKALDDSPYLIVLDGLERILVAYARQDAAYINNEDTIDEQTANQVAGVIGGVQKDSGETFVGRHRLRMTADRRAGQFLLRLARVAASKILISTRLYPSELQLPSSEPIAHCNAHFLTGLKDQDALDLWRAYGARGSRETMLPLFQSFGKHPLLIQILASRVAEFREAPGDFDAWQKANPDFNPYNLEIKEGQSHVLAYSMQDLSQQELEVLHFIAGFKMPIGIRTIRYLFLRQELDRGELNLWQSLLYRFRELRFRSEKIIEKHFLFIDLRELDTTLITLEDRGLIGWDRRSNRYDLHPIVRGCVWSSLESKYKENIYDSLVDHFAAMPYKEDSSEIENLDELKPAIELYDFLIELGDYESAFVVFKNRLNEATLYRFAAHDLSIRLLKRLFKEDSEELPILKNKSAQGHVINRLGIAYTDTGNLMMSISNLERALEIDKSNEYQRNQAVGMSNLAEPYLLTGQVFRAISTSMEGLLVSEKIEEDYGLFLNLNIHSKTLMMLGNIERAEVGINYLLNSTIEQNWPQGRGGISSTYSRLSILRADYQSAKELADKAWQLAQVLRYELDLIKAARFQGRAALQLNDFDTSKERLNYALVRVKAVQLLEEEIEILLDLTELHRCENEIELARERLEEIKSPLEQGPYRLLHADALNILAQIEIDCGNCQAAISAATEAYEKAWCDGPPYAYHWGLKKAEGLLQQLGAPIPELPPFDPSKFPPELLEMASKDISEILTEVEASENE